MSAEIISQVKTIIGLNNNDYDFIIVTFSCFLLFYIFVSLSTFLFNVLVGKK